MSDVVQKNDYDNITTRLVCLNSLNEKCVDCYYNNNICYNCYNENRQMMYLMNFREFKDNTIKRFKRMTYSDMYFVI